MIHNERLYQNRRYRNTIVPSATQDVIPRPGTEINQPDTPGATDGKGWTWIDRFLGTADKTTDLWWKIKTGESVPVGGGGYNLGRPEPGIGMFGIPKPWGAVILIGFVGIVGFSIYKLSK